MTDKVYKVKDQDRYVLGLSEYQNGLLTTGGLYKPEELEVQTEPIVGITYNAEARTELPIGWPRMRFLDDNNKRQFIKEIDFEVDVRPYIMEDGTRSEEVTG